MIDPRVINAATGKIDLARWRERRERVQPVGWCRCRAPYHAGPESRDHVGVLHLDVECTNGHRATIRAARQLEEPAAVPVGV